MSKKLIAKIQSGKVVVRNKTGAELSVWYRDRSGARQFVILGSFATEELAPLRTDAERLESSNITELIQRRALAIV